MKSFIWIGIITVALIGLIFWSVKSSNIIEPPFEAGVIHSLDNIKGNTSSSVLVVEYSDFECPACRTYYLILRELIAEFGEEAAFVYRNFPLTEIHINAEFAARAAQAAGKQGKFWEMHDLLFEKQNEWSKTANIQTLFESYANLIGISVDQFKTDFTSKEVKNFVRAQRANALKLGLKGTPTFFINGKQIENPNSVDAFRAAIRNAIKGE